MTPRRLAPCVCHGRAPPPGRRPPPNLKPIDPAALQAAVEAVGKELLLPGAMVLLRTPEGDFAYGYGATELGGATAPAGDTHFRIASNTKTMTAAVTVLLAQEGKLRLDDPVSKYVQGVPNGDDITVSDLLKMRSGLPEFTDAPELVESLDHDPGRVWTPRGTARHRVQASAHVRSGRGVLLLQHQLHPARPHHRAGRRRAAGPGLPGSPVRTARHDGHAAARRRVDRDPRAVCAWLPVRQRRPTP